jgi:hypothetical protein
MKNILVSGALAIMRPAAIVLVALAAQAPAPALASPQDEFCAGFAEGFKSIKGDMVLVPLCPLMPLTPLGSTPFREGIKAGIAAAMRR